MPARSRPLQPGPIPGYAGNPAGRLSQIRPQSVSVRAAWFAPPLGTAALAAATSVAAGADGAPVRADDRPGRWIPPLGPHAGDDEHSDQEEPGEASARGHPGHRTPVVFPVLRT